MKEDITMIALQNQYGHYKFLVMPFKVKNALTIFKNLMNQVFAPYLNKFTVVFTDKILVYSKIKSIPSI